MTEKLYSESLHDSTLIRFELDWDSGVLEVILQSDPDSERLEVIRGFQVQDFRCPRKFPWGKSISIASVRFSEQPTCTHLEIQMQSGDVVVIEAASFEMAEQLP